ncbi:hypothetical protein TNCV_2001131 [Trichonephila clavipes]|nr:hypothetical protein TNCV_2001131 [Trichonephila clavipes]
MKNQLVSQSNSVGVMRKLEDSILAQVSSSSSYHGSNSQDVYFMSFSLVFLKTSCLEGEAACQTSSSSKKSRWCGEEDRRKSTRPHVKPVVCQSYPVVLRAEVESLQGVQLRCRIRWARR